MIVVGVGFFFDLRLPGLGRGLPVSALSAHRLTWARLGFGVVLPTGFMMFAAHATELASNPAFRRILIAAAVLEASAFQQWPFKSVGRWDVAPATPA